MSKQTRDLIIIVIFLLSIVFLLLGAAEAGMLLSNNAGRCELKFPKWFGCAIANHENLAGGLIGAFGTVVAGVIAWIAVQRQILAGREIANQENLLSLTAIREDMRSLCELLNEFWRAIDYLLSDDLSGSEINTRCRFVVSTLEAYRTISLDSLKTCLTAAPIDKRRHFSFAFQHLSSLDHSIRQVIENELSEQDTMREIRSIWIHLSNLHITLERCDESLALIFKDRARASIELRTPATLIKPFVDEYVRR